MVYFLSSDLQIKLWNDIVKVRRLTLAIEKKQDLAQLILWSNFCSLFHKLGLSITNLAQEFAFAFDRKYRGSINKISRHEIRLYFLAVFEDRPEARFCI